MDEKDDISKSDLARAKVQDFSSDVRRRISGFESQKAVDTLLSAPKLIRRELQEMSFFGALTRFPAATVLFCLILTAFFAYHSGITDQWRDDHQSMNVNGDLAAFLPEGSQVGADIAEVELDWTTNVMIIYVESGENNITDQPILKQMDELERLLNYQVSDD
ncbi:MAG: hypothetical protein P8Q90_04405, partial [Candidatus Thalassarchaeaceae archaeon]|nr:hypothetical protein [Candidatus Thalassarchaeaceae archaeon]